MIRVNYIFREKNLSTKVLLVTCVYIDLKVTVRISNVNTPSATKLQCHSLLTESVLVSATTTYILIPLNFVHIFKYD